LYLITRNLLLTFSRFPLYFFFSQCRHLGILHHLVPNEGATSSFCLRRLNGPPSAFKAIAITFGPLGSPFSPPFSAIWQPLEHFFAPCRFCFSATIKHLKYISRAGCTAALPGWDPEPPKLRMPPIWPTIDGHLVVETFAALSCTHRRCRRRMVKFKQPPGNRPSIILTASFLRQGSGPYILGTKVLPGGGSRAIPKC